MKISKETDLAFADGYYNGLRHGKQMAAEVAERMRPAGGRMWTSEQAACYEALTACAAVIREQHRQLGDKDANNK